jgi:hypothetical protein
MINLSLSFNVQNSNVANDFLAATALNSKWREIRFIYIKNKIRSYFLDRTEFSNYPNFIEPVSKVNVITVRRLIKHLLTLHSLNV